MKTNCQTKLSVEIHKILRVMMILSTLQAFVFVKKQKKSQHGGSDLRRGSGEVEESRRSSDDFLLGSDQELETKSGWGSSGHKECSDRQSFDTREKMISFGRERVVKNEISSLHV